MLVIGSGLGGSVVALQLTKKRYRTGLLAVGRRSPDEHFAEADWDIKRFAWAPLGLKGARRILWLPRVVIHAGFGVVGGSRVLQRIIFVNRCWRGILNKLRQHLPLLSAGLGCLRRTMRRCTAASSAAVGRCSPGEFPRGFTLVRIHPMRRGRRGRRRARRNRPCTSFFATAAVRHRHALEYERAARSGTLNPR
jgi:choline dehydrogenase-like flavoprotein